MADENLVKGLIGHIDPKRTNQKIAGQHPFLAEWIEWYSGRTKWHRQTVVEKNEKRVVEYKQSKFAKMVASAWGGCFLNEKTTVAIGCENDGVNAKQNENDIVANILKDNNFKFKLNHFAEKYFALGLGATVVRADSILTNEKWEVLTDENTKVKIDFVNAERVIPITIENGIVTECGFIRKATNKCTVQVHILINGEYLVAECDGEGQDSGYNLNYASTRYWYTKSTTPLFQLWHPNNTDSFKLDNELGVSCFADSIDDLKIFDTMYHKFFIEFKNGGKKRFISSQLTYVDPETGIESNVPIDDEDIILPNDNMPTAGNQVLDSVSPLRVNEFTKGMAVIANLIGRKAGLGGNSFEIDQTTGMPQTATACILKESEKAKNIVRNELLATFNIEQLVMAIKHVYNTNVKADVLKYEISDISVGYEDNIIEDTATKKAQEQAEVKAGLMNPWEYRAHWFGETEETAKKYMQDNKMLVAYYGPLLADKSITAAQYVDLVFGDGVENKDELINFFSSLQQPPQPIDFSKLEGE